MKLMAVGDLHGDWGKLNALIQQKTPDIVLQCGDFGWWPKMEVTKPVLYGRQKTWILKGIKPRGATVYFCDGNHEEHPRLTQDGLIHKMYDGVHHASRGSILPLDNGRTVMFIGGADSIDKNKRTPGHDWYADENISWSQFEMAMAYDGKIDIIISHTCPGSFDVSGSEGKHNDPNRIALDRILEKFNPDLWLFGHWHKSRKGKHNGTYWECLDYPGHGGKWWAWI